MFDIVVGVIVGFLLLFGFMFLVCRLIKPKTTELVCHECGKISRYRHCLMFGLTTTTIVLLLIIGTTL